MRAIPAHDTAVITMFAAVQSNELGAELRITDVEAGWNALPLSLRGAADDPLWLGFADPDVLGRLHTA
jgi:hypothetical protein